MKEILPGIMTWSVFNEEKGLDFNGHLVVNEEGCAVIDPPPLTEQQAQQAESLAKPTVIVITNEHHTRDAMTLAGRWRARILLPELDARSIPSAVRLGGTYRDGDRLPAGLRVVGLEGQKTPGESALLCEKAEALILGDALIGKPPGQLSLLPAAKYVDIAKARKGLRRLLDFPFDVVLLGDGTSFPSGGRAAIEAFLATS